ncbi:MAG TPA: LpqB family beta-propeller domain-containing protein [Gemmatimonadales bacterium]|nr:LpqB family beta-propeller domain-containing protein [Gemmatimonadales bacterium]
MTSSRALVATCVALALAAGCGGTEPSNSPPVAAFTARCGQLECAFENASTDEDGTLAAYAWDFGDGGTSADSSPTHSYAAPGGAFTVTVSVTDDDGAATITSRQVTVAPGDDLPPANDNRPPVAAFSVTCMGLACAFKDESTDPDVGDSLVSRAWDFGDGTTSSDQNPYHSYAAPGGQFSVVLTVTDNRGAAANATKPVDATLGAAPDVSGTYGRQAPHSVSGRTSRYEIRPDGTFDYIEDEASGQRAFSGRWTFATSWFGWPMEAGRAILLNFNDFSDAPGCGGEGFGVFLLDGELGVSYCYDLIMAGMEEGVYTKASNPGIPDVPPPQVGQLAFVRDGKIYRSNADGTGLVPLSAGPADHSPAWSPDGSRLAFIRAGEAGGLFIMTADGENPVRRAASGTYDPTWSPDGQWVAFACRNGASEAICKVAADGDGSAPVTLFSRQGWVVQPAWSPDGTRIAFVSDWNMFDFWFDIWLVNSDGTQPVVLRNHTSTTPNPEEQWQPAWSPDGQKIALVECPWAFNFCSSSAIAVMNSDGSGLVRLAAASGYTAPAWSPDGQTIAFTSGNSIEWVSVDGMQRGRIIANGTSPAWRP